MITISEIMNGAWKERAIYTAEERGYPAEKDGTVITDDFAGLSESGGDVYQGFHPCRYLLCHAGTGC